MGAAPESPRRTAALREDDGRRVPSDVWRLAFLLAFGSLMAGLDTALVNLGLETMGRQLDAPLSTMQWVQSGYLLALAAALPLCGWLGRRLGAGRLWSWALVGFTAASCLCAFSPTAAVLIVARVLQGVSGGLLVPAGMTVLGQIAGRARMGRVIAVSSVPSILAPALGPPLGAALIASLSWRWLFLINIPVGVVGSFLALRYVPRGERADAGPLDLSSVALASVGLPLTVFGVTASVEAPGAGSTWVCLIAGLVTLAGFVLRSLRTAHPLIDLRVIGNREFGAAAAEVFFGGAALFGGLIVMPLYFQIQLGADVVEAGLLLMAFSVGAAVTFPVAGWLNDRFGAGVVTTVGLVVTVASTAQTAMLDAQPNLVLLEALQVVRGIGLALAGSPGVSAALSAVHHRQVPDASALVNILSRVGGALASALFVAILAAGPAAGGGAAAPAFRTTFWWLTGTAVVALAAAVWLMAEQRRRTA